MLHSIIICLTSERCVREAVGAVARLMLCGFDSQVLHCEGNALPMLPEALRQEETLLLVDDPQLAETLTAQGWYVSGLQPVDCNDPFPGVQVVFSEIDEVDPDSFVKAYERMAGLPWHILTTERCIIRETTMEDLDSFYQIYADPAMTRYMEGLYEDPEDERRYLRDYIDKVYAFLGFGIWTVTLRQDGTVIGRAGYSIREGFEHLELGFLIGTPWQRQGYDLEVCRAILDYGRDVLALDQVETFVKEGNEVSLRLCERLGFRAVGEAELVENLYGDTYSGDMKRVGAEEARCGRYIRMTLRMTASAGK